MTIMTGVQLQEIWEAMRDAFDRDSLKQMLRARLDARLDDYTGDDNFKTMTFDLLTAAEREGWLTDLVRESHRYLPRNAQLSTLYHKYGYGVAIRVDEADATQSLPSTSIALATFEKRIHELNPLVDIAVWREKLALLEGWVCRLELDDRALGTGVLVGRDLVLTNYHVLEQAIARTVPADRFACRFDFKILADKTLETGRAVRLHAQHWNVTFSPYTKDEQRGCPDDSVPDSDHLDYALLRLAEAVGDEPLSGSHALSPARGWAKPPVAFSELQPGLPLIIAQHPAGLPMKLAIDTQGVINCNAQRTRVRYHVNTEAGSSGSPCWTLDWQMVALHHYGDSMYAHPRWNQGIPLACIWPQIVDHLST